MSSPPADGAALDVLLDFLRDERNVDFTGYKRPSLSRRIRKRMDAVQVETYEEYRDYLEVHPREHVQLVDTILINVTDFFRDEEAWRYLTDEVVPMIVTRKAGDGPIRVWSAGCATGQEPYGLAMVLAEALGVEAFRQRVKIYATDTDDQALSVARSGAFTQDQLASVPDHLRDRYFEPTADGRLGFRSDCRRSVIFGRHDVTRDAPISRLDLLVCRNVLMYFERDTQRKVLDRFHYALSGGGFLFLGKAETIFAHADLFSPTSSKFRVFAAEHLDGARTRRAALATTRAGATVGDDRIRELAASATPVAQIVIDLEGAVVDVNTRARAMFGISMNDIGRPFGDLDVSFRPVELRSRIAQALAESRPMVISQVERALGDGRTQFLEVSIAPLIDSSGQAHGASVSFGDVTELGRAKAELERFSRQLESANASLHSSNEELETSNEELQSTNEELETTNEELQSANEELETMNEELQSANGELETMNEELLDQSHEISRSASFLAGLMDSLTVGVVVVDSELDVVVWNRQMEKTFGFRADEAIGRSLLALDIGVPFSEIRAPLHAAVKNDHQGVAASILDAVDRAGHPFRCRVSVDRLDVGDRRDGTANDPRFVVLVDRLPAETSAPR